jgi:sugar phosphate isomerase/epimerase
VKLCLPSWQQPGTWLQNCLALKPYSWVQGIELLFFTWDAKIKTEFSTELEGIQRLKRRFSFSLHLPEIIAPETEELIALTNSFVQLYVFHPWEEGKGDSSLEDWTRLVDRLRSAYGKDRFAMEYTGEIPFKRAMELLPNSCICADTGCLLRNRCPPAPWIRERASSIREIHLHAAQDGRDHFALSSGDAWLPELAKAALASDWRIVLETFSLEESLASYRVFEEALA